MAACWSRTENTPGYMVGKSRKYVDDRNVTTMPFVLADLNSVITLRSSLSILHLSSRSHSYFVRWSYSSDSHASPAITVRISQLLSSSSSPTFVPHPHCRTLGQSPPDRVW